MKEKFRNSFLLNLALVFVLGILLYVLFFASLNCITHHGEEVAMPDVRGKKMDSALTALKTLNFEVMIDSTYDPSNRPLSVLKQVPDTGSYVKRGRTIFLTVNKLAPPKVSMPAIKDLSYRSAEMILRNNKLIVGDTTYKPDIATGAILEASMNGKVLTAGDMIQQGSKIDLVIGNGLGNTEWDVPNVTGMTVDEAMIYLNQFNLQPFLVAANRLSEITDTPSAIITDQRPREYNDAGARNRIKMNDFIDLLIMQNPAAEDIHVSVNNTNNTKAVNNDKSQKRR